MSQLLTCLLPLQDLGLPLELQAGERNPASSLQSSKMAHSPQADIAPTRNWGAADPGCRGLMVCVSFSAPGMKLARALATLHVMTVLVRHTLSLPALPPQKPTWPTWKA